MIPPRAIPNLPESGPVFDIVEDFINHPDTSKTDIAFLCAQLATRSDYFHKRYVDTARRAGINSEVIFDVEVLVDAPRLVEFMQGAEFPDEAQPEADALLKLALRSGMSHLSVDALRLFNTVMPAQYLLELKDHRDYLLGMLLKAKQMSSGVGAKVTATSMASPEMISRFSETYRARVAANNADLDWESLVSVSVNHAFSVIGSIEANCRNALQSHESFNAFNYGYTASIGTVRGKSLWSSQIGQGLDCVISSLPEDILRTTIAGLIKSRSAPTYDMDSVDRPALYQGNILGQD